MIDLVAMYALDGNADSYSSWNERGEHHERFLLDTTSSIRISTYPYLINITMLFIKKLNPMNGTIDELING